MGGLGTVQFDIGYDYGRGGSCADDASNTARSMTSSLDTSLRFIMIG
jgi:hypothetical protein